MLLFISIALLRGRGGNGKGQEETRERMKGGETGNR